MRKGGRIIDRACKVKSAGACYPHRLLSGLGLEECGRSHAACRLVSDCSNLVPCRKALSCSCEVRMRQITRHTNMQAAVRSLRALPAIRLRLVRRIQATAAEVPKGRVRLQGEQLTGHRLVYLSRCRSARASRRGSAVHRQERGALEGLGELRVRVRRDERLHR